MIDGIPNRPLYFYQKDIIAFACLSDLKVLTCIYSIDVQSTTSSFQFELLTPHLDQTLGFLGGAGCRKSMAGHC